MLILGKGSSALETAGNLIPTTALLAHRQPPPLGMRAVNNNFLDTCRLNLQNAVLDCTVERIERRDGQLMVSVRYSRAQGETAELAYDRVIVATGFRFDSSIFASGCRPELARDGRFPAQTPEWESVNVPGLYFAGTLTQANDDRQHASGFINGFRYNARALFRMLEQKHHHRDWPSREIEPTPEGLVEATLDRLNRSLRDVAPGRVPPRRDRGRRRLGPAVHYEEMPLAYIQESEIAASGHYYTITLELGEIAEESAALHPVIRRWSGRQLISEKHLPEDLIGEWKKPEAHIAPLRYFFMQQLLETADLAHGYDAVPVPVQEKAVRPLLRAV